jgi:hypothetical protein
MTERRHSARTWVSIIVFAHLLISLIHGTAHSRGHIAMSMPANVFVFVVILAGPLLGLLLLWRNQRAGYGVIAATLATSFVFGLVNHFLVPGPDHVAHVAAHVRPVFTGTAVLLALTEVAGAALALRAQRRVRSIYA